MMFGSTAAQVEPVYSNHYLSVFLQARPRLFGIAYRMLGSAGGAAYAVAIREWLHLVVGNP